MAEKRDISKLSKIELVDMLQRQEKLLKNGQFLKSLPDKGQKVHDLVKKLKEMIAKRKQAEDLTARFQQITISQSKNSNQDQEVELDSDDDDDDDNISDVNMDNRSANSTETETEAKCSDLSAEDSKKTKADKWAYDSAVTYARKPKYEKSKEIPIDESIKIQQVQKDEYEALRAKQAAERLMQHRNPASSSLNFKFTTHEAKDRYRDTIKEEEIQDEDLSESEDIVNQELEESDED